MQINVYEGKFGKEKRLFRLEELEDCDLPIAPIKGSFIFYENEIYKVMYCVTDVHNDEYAVFVRKAVEEDY